MCKTKMNTISNFIIYISEWEDTIAKILICPNYCRFEAVTIRITV